MTITETTETIVEMDFEVIENTPATAQAWRQRIDRLLEDSEWFRRASQNASRTLHSILTEHGEDRRELADMLHGKQIGHALHPVLTDITIGGWTFGLFFDLLGLFPRTKHLRKLGDRLTLLGTAAAVPTALTGITDYSTIKRDAAGHGAAHGLLNGIAFLAYVRSLIARLTGNRRRAFLSSLIGMGVVTISSWLGGDLVYRQRVGVNHTTDTDVDGWTPVMPLDDLEDHQPTRADADGVPVLLFRQGSVVHAINAVCSHAGGPLDEGTVVDGVCIECPWHQSVFDMRDGHIVHSPATFEQPRYAVRVRDGQIEVRGPAN